jgi:hypothetical protein
MRDLNEVPAKKLPFVIGEFGNYGAGSGPVDNDGKVYDGALSTTAYMFRMINLGVAGLARWEFHIYGNEWRNFGALTGMDSNFIFKPYGPVFYPHAITARYVRPGWKVRETRVEGEGEGIWATALASAEDDITVLLLNDSANTVSILLKFEIPFHHSVLHHLSVTGSMPEGIELHPDVTPGRAGIRVTLPAKSITALTSLPPGDLGLPRKLSLKK